MSAPWWGDDIVMLMRLGLNDNTLSILPLYEQSTFNLGGSFHSCGWFRCNNIIRSIFLTTKYANKINDWELLPANKCLIGVGRPPIMIGPQNGSRWASHSAGSPPHGSSSTLISAFCDHWTICARSSAALCRRCGCSQLHLTDVNCSRKAAAASITFIFYARRKLFAVQKHCVKLVIWLVAGHLVSP